MCQGLRQSSQPRARVISGAAGKTPSAEGPGGGNRSREEGVMLYQLLHITERWLVARQRSAAAGRQTHPSAACTPHRAHRLIPRLKFTFAPSRLNSHFSSSHNTPLSRDTEMMGPLLAPHAKYVQFFTILFFFFFKYTLIVFLPPSS